MPVQSTEIAWTDDSANHWVGCAKVSEGCANCWAADVAARFDRTPEPWTIANVDANLQVYDEDINDLLARRRPGWCFFPSSSDPYLPWLPSEAYVDYFEATRENEQHCFQVLTKWGPEAQRSEQDALPHEYEPRPDPTITWPPHVILGVTVESNLRTYRLDWLRKQDAAIKFVSFEPLLEEIEDPDLSGIDWAIVGGESGDNRREWDARWATSIREACHDQDTAFFFKQHGDRFPEERVYLDGRKWREVPETPAGVPDAPRDLDEEVVVVR